MGAVDFGSVRNKKNQSNEKSTGVESGSSDIAHINRSIVRICCIGCFLGCVDEVPELQDGGGKSEVRCWPW